MEPIFSMAKSIKEMEKFFKKHSIPWLVHMFLIYYYPGIVGGSYWWADSYRVLPHKSKVFTGTHKYPDEEFINNNLFLWVASDTDRLKKEFVDKLKKERRSLPKGFSASFDDALKIISYVADEVAQYLSSPKDDFSLSKDDYFSILEKYRFGMGR